MRGICTKPKLLPAQGELVRTQQLRQSRAVLAQQRIAQGRRQIETGDLCGVGNSRDVAFATERLKELDDFRHSNYSWLDGLPQVVLNSRSSASSLSRISRFCRNGWHGGTIRVDCMCSGVCARSRNNRRSMRGCVIARVAAS